MANPTSYQRVTTATDYDASAGFLYLKFDGVDDALSTGTVDFTATDKMTVVAGVRKLSDAGIGMVAELSVTGTANAGAFSLSAPPVISAAAYGFRSRGSVDTSQVTANNFASPITNVLSLAGNIAGDLSTLRINGAQAAANTSDQGTGNYGNYPLYIGSRGGTSLPFNGHLYSLLIRGAQSTDAQIVSAETYVAAKTGVVL